ncbi:MAG: DeoR/GlpR family DNA-binding transcription regulator [Anaerolineae bacterium]
MPENLFVEERRRLIIEQLMLNGRVSVNTLSENLGVSTVTIRQDLRALEEVGLLERTYGGAVRKTSEEYLPELSFHVRQKRNWREKQIIAAAAVAQVKDGYTVALDCSTTAYALVPQLKKFKKLTIVTNSLFIAQSFLDSPGVHVLMPSGRLRRDSISLVGKPEALPNINLNVGFFGTRGISLVGGITDIDADEVAMKQAMIAHCLSTVILADSSKWGEVAPYKFVRPEQIERIITSTRTPETLIRQFREASVQVDVVEIR